MIEGDNIESIKASWERTKGDIKEWQMKTVPELVSEIKGDSFDLKLGIELVPNLNEDRKKATKEHILEVIREIIKRDRDVKTITIRSVGKK